MKKSMAFGGLVGFSMSLACGILAEGSAWPGILLRSSIAGLVTGFLLRWWVGLAGQCLADAQAARPQTAPSPKPPLNNLTSPR